MLTKDQALEMVAERLAKMTSPDKPFVVVDADTIQKPYGWIFFFNSKKFIDTGVFIHRLAGNGPVIVNKFLGTIDVYGTNKPVDAIIKEYEAKTAGP